MLDQRWYNALPQHRRKLSKNALQFNIFYDGQMFVTNKHIGLANVGPMLSH